MGIIDRACLEVSKIIGASPKKVVRVVNINEVHDRELIHSVYRAGYKFEEN